jgi:thymidylate synthase (FAD)
LKAELLDYMGNDLMAVNVARVSYGKWSTELNHKDIRLLEYLFEHKHISPWRHPVLQWRIEVPIFVERQLFKHQVGLSANSISGRYVDFSESFWKLDKLRKQSISSKQGSSDEILDDPELLKEWYNVIDVSQATYKKMIAKGVAKEIARTILPLALNTTFIWTGSLLAFLHLFNLRLKSDAQEETRIIVSSMLEQTKQLKRFEHTLRIWGF